MITQLKQRIENKVFGICAGGQSIEELETYLPRLDMCWGGLGGFDVVERGIFRPHGQRFNVVFDAASIPHARIPHYEGLVRIPRLEDYLSREDSIFITTGGLIRDSFKAMDRMDIVEKYKDKIIEVDKLFPSHNYMDVPNSLTLFTAALVAAGVRKIILFGCDGVKTGQADNLHTYYHAHEVSAERMSALGTFLDGGISRDKDNFETMFREKYDGFCKLFNHYPEVVNCSPITVYTNIRTINYEDLHKELQ